MFVFANFLVGSSFISLLAEKLSNSRVLNTNFYGHLETLQRFLSFKSMQKCPKNTVKFNHSTVDTEEVKVVKFINNLMLRKL